MTKIVVINFCIFISILLFSRDNTIRIVLVTTLLLLHIMKRYYELICYERHFSKEFELLIDRIIFSIKLGNGFRESLESEANKNSYKSMTRIKEIYSYVTFSQQNRERLAQGKPTTWTHIVNYFLELDHNPHLCLKKLEVKKKELKRLKKFRRRSGQIIGQVVSQMAVILFFYSLSFAYALYTNRWANISGLIIYSSLLLMVGILVMFYLSRTFRIKL